MSHKTIKSISNPKLKLEILTTEENQKIHSATLWIIEHVGVRFPSKRALEIWEAHGATVDHEKKIGHDKGDLIEKALTECPPTYSLAARDPCGNAALNLGGKKAADLLGALQHGDEGPRLTPVFCNRLIKGFKHCRGYQFRVIISC